MGWLWCRGRRSHPAYLAYGVDGAGVHAAYGGNVDNFNAFGNANSL